MKNGKEDQEEKVSGDETSEKEGAYDLQGSKKAIGPLYPILVDAQGRFIDGKHRQQIDENWPIVVKDEIKTDLQLHMARLSANFFRRKMKPEEIREEVTWIAEHTSWPPKRIAEETGLAYRTVTKYLPDKYKDQEMKRRSQIAATKRKSDKKEASDASVHHEKARIQEARLMEQQRADKYNIYHVMEYEKYTKGLAEWWAIVNNPILGAIAQYCCKKMVPWPIAVRDSLTHFFKEKGYTINWGAKTGAPKENVPRSHRRH